MKIPKTKQYDAVVIGAGFAGAAAARALADAGLRVLVTERRPHIGGNAYDCRDENGILIHRYGPHIFHTNDKRVFDFLSRFTVFSGYSHKVAAKIGDSLIPVPFNLNSIDAVFPERAPALREKLLSRYAPESKIPVFELTQQDDPELSALADYIFENIFRHYTEKQWGVPIGQVSRETLSRVPVFLSRDDRYFQDKYQGMPETGYTALFSAMLDSEGITVLTSTDASGLLSLGGDGRITLDGREFSGEIIYTGAADELFGTQFGRLPYRTLDFVFETVGADSFQKYGTVNYTVSEKFTRITEFKHLTGQVKPGVTTIMKEYPREYSGGGDIPYYAVLNEENIALYEKYRALAQNYRKLHLLGRLAEYKYYNMDATVARALALCDTIINK